MVYNLHGTFPISLNLTLFYYPQLFTAWHASSSFSNITGLFVSGSSHLYSFQYGMVSQT